MKLKRVSKIAFISGISVCLFFTDIPASPAQDAPAKVIDEQERQIRDEEARELRVTEKEEKEVKDVVIDGGAWVFSSYRNYKNIDNDRDTEDWVKDAYIVDTRIWLKATFYRALMAYGRVKNYFIWRPNVSSDYTGIGNDYEGPAVDALYGILDLRRVIDLPVSVSVGRQYLSIGKGITYSNVHDGIKLQSAPGGKVGFKAFASKTKEYENNIDYRMPGYRDHGDRQFYAAEGAVFIPYAALYAYGLIQRDLSRAEPEVPGKNYRYHSHYLGAGISGRKDGYSVWGEVIKEYGKSYTDALADEQTQNKVDAWAFDAGLKRRFDCYGCPTIEGEIAYGSGDGDRTHVTCTRGGNTNGKDTNFLYFGVFSGGYALAPRLSNMFVYKVAASCMPFEAVPWLGKNVALGSKYYIYRKDKTGGGIYDVDATNRQSADIGQEVDFFAHWRVSGNLRLACRYGLFFPGAAYPSETRDTSQYVYTRVSLMF